MVTEHQENAKVVLSLLKTVAVKFDDCGIGATIKLWLLNIESGELIVAFPEEPKQAAEGGNSKDKDKDRVSA